MHPQVPLTRDLVLVGGGHAHALLLRMWGMAPVHGVQVTLINPGPTAPYSGMLPGHIAGHYCRDALEIDLIKLARFAGVRIILGSASAIDTERQVVHVQGRGAISYDVVSLDVGLHGQTPNIAGFADHGIGAKPLDRYADEWQRFVSHVETGLAHGNVAVIGAGIAGCELALASAHRLAQLGKHNCVSLIEGQNRLAANTPGADKVLRRAMADLGVEVLCGQQVDHVSGTAVVLEDGREVAAEFTVGTVGGFAHDWLASSALPTDEQGFVLVDENLAVPGCDGVFAVGDCAALTGSPRPKAGVFAVRAAPVLFHNLGAALTGGTYKPFQPQQDYLKLMSLGGKVALAAKWGRVLSQPQHTLWQWKDHIDQKFMRRFTTFPQMPSTGLKGPVAEGSSDAQILCGGCGAKVAPSQLGAALARLPKNTRDDVVRGIGDDAAVLDFGSVQQVISVDHLRGFVADHGLMSQIAAVHALGDVWAMGAAPQSVLVSVTLPRMSATLQARAMDEVLTGVGDIVRQAGAEIVGGHSSMGSELTIGLTVTGLLHAAPITVDGAKAGDALILTRPIGSGTLLAAEMQGQADGRDVAALLEVMARPQADSAEVLGGAHAMTDVTGFGLAGHLMAICRGSNLSAKLNLRAVPVFSGAVELADAGHRSTIFEDNKRAAPVFGPDSGKMALLHDPQTSGGFLAAVPSEEADALVLQLTALGHSAALIGTLKEGPPQIVCV